MAKMINELYLLKLNPENASTKQKIISVLGIEWPLTAKQVYERVQKEYGTNISYQGVHKIIRELEENRVISRMKNGYQLSIEWIQNSKKTLEDVEKRYLQKQKIKIPGGFSGAIEIEFDSFTDMCLSITDLLSSRQLVKNSKESLFIGLLEYGWWPFNFEFDQFQLLLRMAIANPNPKYIIKNKTLFGEWIAKQYSKVGASGLIGVETGINEDLILSGDYLLEVQFDEETKKMFQHYFSKWKNIEDVFKEFGLKDEPKIHATLRITKNPEMAAFMRKQLEPVFEKRGGDKK